MLVSRMLLGAALLVCVANGATAKQLSDSDRLRAEAEHLCYDDVQKLCGDSIPDEDKIKACMGQKRAQLSPSCLKVFDQGMKDQ